MTGTWFVPDETLFIEKKVIAGRIDLIGINRIEADELADFIESAAQVDSSDALDGGVNQEGFQKIRVSLQGLRLQPLGICGRLIHSEPICVEVEAEDHHSAG